MARASVKTKRGAEGLDERLLALGEAVEVASGVIDDRALAPARALVARAGERLGHGIEHTVVALAGATGSGKSSLFNALVGEAVSTVGVRRPTTSHTSAAVWGDGADALLDWLAVPSRLVMAADADDRRSGLVLLDLPDHDSTAAAHRAEVDRVVAIADMVVWVLDPQKYADAAVHEGYLQPLASHGAVLLVVLNQLDRLEPAALAACRADLDRLLRADGLRAEVLATSATTGAGVPELEAELARRVATRSAAIDRLAADADDVASALDERCAGSGVTSDAAHRDGVVAAMAEAAGVRTVTDAVARSHQSQGTRRVGWPFTRWLGRMRPDPLRRLHLPSGGGSGARTSLPPATEVARARLATTVRDLAEHAGGDLAGDWRDALRHEVLGRVDGLADRLDATVAATDLGVDRSPRWWSLAAALQWVLALMALAGGVWLAVLAALGYLQLGDPGTPDLVGEIPLPTAMLLGGGGAGIVLAALARPLVALGARRRARRADRRLRRRLDDLAESALLAPAADVVARHRSFCDALRRARRR